MPFRVLCHFLVRTFEQLHHLWHLRHFCYVAISAGLAHSTLCRKRTAKATQNLPFDTPAPPPAPSLGTVATCAPRGASKKLPTCSREGARKRKHIFVSAKSEEGGKVNSDHRCYSNGKRGIVIYFGNFGKTIRDFFFGRLNGYERIVYRWKTLKKISLQERASKETIKP